jgi:hypothetical protein
LYSLDDKVCCVLVVILRLHFKSGDHSDIDGKELFMELKLLQDFIPREHMEPGAILKFVKQMGMFPKCSYCKQIFIECTRDCCICGTKILKNLKLLKSYLHSNMTRERLN